MTTSTYSQPIRVLPSCQMLSIAGATGVGANQITQVTTPNDNPHGILLLNFYTQVIQTGAPGNSAQSLVVASATAPVNFDSKERCFPIYRTFQSDKQDPIALGGFAPLNLVHIQIPPRWGIWQIVTVIGAALDRNNMRFGIVYL